MTKEFIKKAIRFADIIDKLYFKINCHRVLGNKELEKTYLLDLQFVLKMEEELYRSINPEEIDGLRRQLINRNPEFLYTDYGDIVFGTVSNRKEYRVYNHLIYWEEITNYYNEFSLKPLEESLSSAFLKNKMIHQALLFLLQNMHSNPYYDSTFVFEKLYRALAYYYKDIEKIYWQEEKVVWESIPENAFAFGRTLDLYVEEIAQYFAINSFDSYFKRLIEIPRNYFAGEEFYLQQPIHEFYIRFLFLLIPKQDIRNSYKILLFQYGLKTPNYLNVLNNSLNSLEEDSRLMREHVKK